MKVTSKLFVVALILSLILTVSAVAAAEDITFDQSDVQAVSEETNIELSEEEDTVLAVSEDEKDSNPQIGGGENQLLGEVHTVEGNDFKNITTKINSAKAGDTIFLGGKTYTGNNSQININKDNLIIIGGSSLEDDSYATLDAQSTSRIMQVIGKNVVLKNIKFINGNITGDGGAILWSGSNCTLKNSIFIDNYATRYGGAIQFTGVANIKIDGCTFDNNYVTTNAGGAIRGSGQCDNSSIINSIFTNNRAIGTDGGAIIWYGANSKIINSNFTNNSAKNGGAIMWYGANGIFTACNFTNNSANYGGAIRLNGENGRVSNSKFINNSANVYGGALLSSGVNCNVTDSTFTNNSANSRGGAIYVDGPAINFTVNKCTLDYNLVKVNSGGAILSFAPNTIVNNSLFVNNTALQAGGAGICFGEGSYDSSVINTNFTDNRANKQGGAIYSISSGYQNTTVTNCNFYNNYGNSGGAILINAMYSTLSNLLFVNNTAGDTAGAVYLTQANHIIKNCEFYNGTSKRASGALYLAYLASNVTATDLIFANNRASSSCGAVYSAANNVTFANCNFTNNSAYNYGAIFMDRVKTVIGFEEVYYGDDSKIINCNFINNTATNNVGSLYLLGANGILNNSNFINNAAGNLAGAVIWGGDNGTAFNCNFTNNHANGTGGALRWNGVNGTLSNSNFINNSANAIGGATNWNGANGTISGCTYTNNSANKDGGAIRWNGVNGTLINTKFINNSAAEYGGATNWVGANGTMTDCVYNNNSAYWGGAIEWYGANATSRNCNFTNNHANETGGAIRLHITAVNSTFTDCNFISNSADVNAGAIGWNADNGTISNCEFTNNHALDGGATDWAGVNGTLTGCTFTGNKANYTGGASHWSGANGTISNCDYINNSAKIGGAIHSIADGLTVNGNTFKDNDAVYAGSDVSVDGPNTNILNNKINNTGSNATSIYVTDSANLTESGNTFTDPSKSVDYASMVIEVDDVYIGHVDKTLTIPVYVHDTNGVPALGQIQLFGYGTSHLTDGRAAFTIAMPKFQTTMYLTMIYEDGTYRNFMVEVADTNSPIEEAIQPDNGRDELVLHFPKDATGNVTVTINGKNYTSNVVDGFAVIEVNDIPNGNYPATVHYSGDANYSAITQTMTFAVKNSNVNPVTKLLSNVDVSVIYSGNAYYKVLVSKEGKLVGAGESVTINFNGKNTVAKTDANGYINYKILSSIKPGTYKIKATYHGSTVTNNVKIGQIIKASNKKVKKSVKVSKVKITLNKVDGKFLSTKVLKIKFNKKTYKVKTNKKGVATWKVKKSMLKKLKVGKKVKYTVTYGKAVVTKKLTIKK